MPLSHSKTLNYFASDFVDAKPSYATSLSTSINNSFTYTKGILYANISIPLDLTTTDYGYVIFDITYNGGASFAGISFSTDNESTIAVGTDLDDLFIFF